VVPISTLLEYDPLDPAVLVNPYPLYAELLRKRPVFWHKQMQSWVVTRYRDCREVLRNYETFARDRRRVGVEVPDFAQNLQSLDPPQLGPFRSLLINAFRSQDLPNVAAQTSGRIMQIFKRTSVLPEFDWIHEVAAPVALTITSELFGVEEPELNSYVSMADLITRRMDAGLNSAVVEPGDLARTQLNKLAEGWLADNRDGPGLLNTLKKVSSQGGLPEHYLRNSTGVMFNASYGTVFAAVGNVALTLLEHPGALEMFRDEKLMSSGVEELIRYDGPAQGTSRVAAKDVLMGDAVIRAGEPVITLLAAANRDPEEFPRPDELILDRSPNRHLAFGWGPHACLGALFGHVAVKEIIVCLLKSPSSLRLTGTPVRRATATVRSMDFMPVSFRENPAASGVANLR
jgi:cytochrome P450